MDRAIPIGLSRAIEQGIGYIRVGCNDKEHRLKTPIALIYFFRPGFDLTLSPNIKSTQKTIREAGVMHYSQPDNYPPVSGRLYS